VSKKIKVSVEDLRKFLVIEVIDWCFQSYWVQILLIF
jgi:hypothetical protein